MTEIGDSGRTSVTCCWALVLICFGFVTPSAAGDTPYVAALSGDRVRLRTGASRDYFAFTAVRAGQQVIVVESSGEWSMVVLPRSIPVYVHEGYVRAEGQSGVVTADRLMVRVGPEKKHESVGTLSQGERVKVLGRDGHWLRIEPTAGTSGWIHRQYLKPAKELRASDVARAWQGLDDGMIGDARAAAGVSTRSHRVDAPAVGRAKKAALVSGAGRDRVTTTSTLSGSTSVREIYRRLKASLESQEIVAVDLSPFRERFEGVVEESEDLTEIALAKQGIEIVAAIEDRSQKVRRVESTLAQADAEDERIQDRLKDIRNARLRLDGESDASKEKYVARGWVVDNGQFIGRQGTHCLMKGNKVLFYLQGKDGGGIKLDAFVNRMVGIRGVVQELEPKFGADLILVADVKVLADY